MNFDIDISIVVGFLLITLFIGLGHGKRVKNIKDYALGGRNFSTGALVATIVATWASGSGFFIILSKTYSDGFYYFFVSLGIGLSLFLTSTILVPRMGEFLGKISVAEAMGDLYGSKVRIITAIAGAIGSAGYVAMQFRIFGSVFSYFIGISQHTAIIISGTIVTIYSAFGGIKSVTFTDILQGVAFCVVVPLLGFTIWKTVYEMDYSIVLAMENSKFNLNTIFDTSNKAFWNSFLLFAYFSIPGVSTTLFQRISMSSDLHKVKKAIIISAIIFIGINFAITWIPFLVSIINPSLESDELLVYIVNEFSFVGLKGLILVAIIAFSMSTADSYINTSSVLFTHDIYGLFSKNKKRELAIVKIFSCILGFSTIILSLVQKDLLDMIIFANSFFFPLVSPPFLFTVFGFRSSSKSVLMGMFAGLVITILWKFLPDDIIPFSQSVIGVFVAMIGNTIFLFGSHYLLKQKGGWVGIKDKTYLDQQEIFKRQKRKKLKEQIRNFDLMKLWKKIEPKSDLSYTALGIYLIVYTITTMYSSKIELLGKNAELIRVIYPSMLITGTLMSMYPIWPLSIGNANKKIIIRIWYPVAVFYMLIFFSFLFVIISNFSILQVAIFCINTMIAALLLGWRLSLPLILVGFYSSIQFYQHFFAASGFEIQLGSPEFILIYIVLFLGSAVIIFLKPRQEYQELTEAKAENLETEVIHLDYKVNNLTGKVTNLNNQVSHYNERVVDQEKEIERLGATAERILNNVNHELRLPVGNVKNFSQMLHEGLEKYTPKQLKELSDEVYKNSERLSSMILNMLDLAMLKATEIKLQKKTINLGVLVEDRVKICRNVYLQNKPIDFKLTIEPEILICVDPNYIRQVVDNIIINAISFSDDGVIEVILSKEKHFITLIVKDEGKGIPPKELSDVFDPFKMGSNTESKAHGRGVGLALCKAAVEAHGGTIKAQSNGKKGATFKVMLPIDI